jgi:hypothetical protein
MPSGVRLGQFAARHIQRDGRVIDFNTPQQQSTSEGQSYSLFFALVHDDKPHLRARAGLDRSQPRAAAAWPATCRPGNGAANPTADGACSMRMPPPTPTCGSPMRCIEAARLWNEPRYAQLGRSLLALVVRDEVVALPGLGRMLLPWPRRWRAVRSGGSTRATCRCSCCVLPA